MNLFILALTESQKNIADIIIYVLSACVIPFIVGWLRSKQREAIANAEMAEMDRMQKLVQRVKAFMYGSASNIAEREFPVLAKAILDGKLTTQEQIRAELNKWGFELKMSAKEYFSEQGLDLVAEVGDTILDNWIERAANHVSPTPGMVTSQVMLQKQVSSAIVQKGVDYVRENAVELVDGSTKVAPVITDAPK